MFLKKFIFYDVSLLLFKSAILNKFMASLSSTVKFNRQHQYIIRNINFTIIYFTIYITIISLAFLCYLYEHFSKSMIIVMIMIFIKDGPNKHYYIIHIYRFL